MWPNKICEILNMAHALKSWPTPDIDYIVKCSKNDFTALSSGTEVSVRNMFLQKHS